MVLTNKDKYLKDGVSPKAMWYEFKNWYNDTQCTCAYGEAIEIFMKESVKPTLTEDEKVILKLASKKHETIKRSEYNNLFINNIPIASLFGENLFQFIQPRRRI